MNRLRLAVLISGIGRTLKNLLDRSARGEIPAEVAIVISSDPDAPGNGFGRDAGIPVHVFSRGDYDDPDSFSRAISGAVMDARSDLVCMAGFVHLWRIPRELRGRVMNIHPALIPSFCGKGLYGSRVPRAVLRRGAKVSGCTVHFADDAYDHGPIILQRTVPVLEEDTPETLAERVFAEECEAYPEAIRLFAEGRLRIRDGRVQIARPK